MSPRIVMLLCTVLTLGGRTGAPVGGCVTGLEGNDHVVVKMTPTVTEEAATENEFSATTRYAGHWQVPEVPSGRYRVTPYHKRYRFEPSSRSITVRDRAVRAVDFTAVAVAPSEKPEHDEVPAQLETTLGSSFSPSSMATPL